MDVVFVSSTTFGASALTSGFFSSGLLHATSDVARATRARADVSFFMIGILLRLISFDRTCALLASGLLLREMAT